MVVIIELLARSQATDEGGLRRLEAVVAALLMLGPVELVARALAPDDAVVCRPEVLATLMLRGLVELVA
jgi:hypothetical protein